MRPSNAPKVFAHFRIATMAGAGSDLLGLIDDGAIVVKDGRIEWVGPRDTLPVEYQSAETVDGQGKLITPGLIDCHTHLVFGGNRVDDWRKRLEGVSYQEIARQGGGILSTVRATRATPEDELFQEASRRLAAMVRGGVTTIEIKSGYGLDLETEKKLLRVIKRLSDECPIRVVPTLLAAHAVPQDFRGYPDRYVELICKEIIPACAADCVAVDAFCESIAFDLTQTERVLRAAIDHRKQIKLHAEQLSNMGGARLAARLGAISADHLEFLDEAGVHEMAERGAVAVLLPGAFYFLRETQKPPVELLRRFGVPMAVATDFNPGSSPIGSLLMAGNMAATLFGMTPTEVLLGMTINAARALRLDSSIGSLEIGKQADFVCWDCASPFELIYASGMAPSCRVYSKGKLIGA
jgi:imidazolonepropionase